MITYTVLIREVVTTDRRVTLHAESREAAEREAVGRAASGVYAHSPQAARTEKAFPLLSTLEQA